MENELMNGKRKESVGKRKKQVVGFALSVSGSLVGGKSANLFFFRKRMRLSTAALFATAGDKPCSS
jgi:hypothetical protein